MKAVIFAGGKGSAWGLHVKGHLDLVTSVIVTKFRVQSSGPRVTVHIIIPLRLVSCGLFQVSASC